jgi:hypothetical protein
MKEYQVYDEKKTEGRLRRRRWWQQRAAKEGKARTRQDIKNLELFGGKDFYVTS